MKDSKKIFFDTAPIIYYLQESDLYFNTMISFLRQNRDGDYVISAITATEYLTYPFRENDEKLINDFYSFIDDMEVEIKEIDMRIAVKAAQIRAEYKFFKPLDSLQLATACITGCDIFLTNDKQLKQFKEIKCVTMADIQ
jgi:predicted nucleic acid-binding protein|nr:MAG TPA: PIN domain [Caudoviricetes sp.]